MLARCGGLVFAVLCVAGFCAHAADAATFLVSSAADAGPNTLRAAINQANLDVGADAISFSIGGGGAKTITLTSGALPKVTEPLLIDATTQPGYAGTPLIRLENGTGVATITGLNVLGGSSKVLGLSITRFGTGIRLATNGGNTVSASYIGVTRSGAEAGNGIGVQIGGGSSGNVIGGLTAAERNVISGNTSFGIRLSDSGTTGNTIVGNYVGVAPTGLTALPNAYGIGIFGGANGNTVGGTTLGARNVISGNADAGVHIQSRDNVVAGNYIGPGRTAGAIAASNGRSGVETMQGAVSNTIGGTATAARNLISGNAGVGVELGPASSSTVVEGNYIGTNATGSAALPNTVGVTVVSNRVATDNTIGGVAAGARNMISGNLGDGIDILGSEVVLTPNTVVEGNRIGTNAAGNAAVPNGNFGIYLIGSKNTIGGTSAEARNVISGNAAAGIMLSGGSAVGNTIEGNFVGVDAAGAEAVPNSGDGVTLGANVTKNAIGGGNVISGNVGSGVTITGFGGSHNSIWGNRIGTDATGRAALPNTDGVDILDGASENSVAGNVISGNRDNGVLIDHALRNDVFYNYIGTDATGAAPLGNATGIAISDDAFDNTIGGPRAGTRNVVSGNLQQGVLISGVGTTGNTVLGNFIGTTAAGTTALANGSEGVSVGEGASGNTVGGSTGPDWNRIAFNGGAGVSVDGSSGGAHGDSILRNSIFSNGGLGIALVNGGNNSQPAPLIAGVSTSGGTTTITGTLGNSAPSTAFHLEFFASGTCDPSGSGEGAQFLGARDATTDGSGSLSFSASVPAPPAGSAITATATSSSTGDTSQFSACEPS